VYCASNHQNNIEMAQRYISLLISSVGSNNPKRWTPKGRER
jgi:hypothetical protein